jgi:putative ABC transport system ATP-binding protein
MLLEANDLHKSYGRGSATVHALRGVSVTLDRSEFTAIVGPSGSGKTTLMQLLGGLDRPSSGSIKLGDRDLTHISDGELSAFRRTQLGFVFQFFHLVPTLSAAENVALPLMLDGQPFFKLKERADALLQEVGLAGRGHHRPHELSGGEMQRVAVARALVAQPQLVLADEPTGNLDTKTGNQVLDLLQKVVKDHGASLLMVTHDPKAADRADRIIEMRDGQVERDWRR